jgi:hypothetical protein
MRPSNSFSLFSALLGASVSVTIATVFGTAIFNGMVWFTVGTGTPFDQAYAAAPQHPLYFVLGFANSFVGGMLGGYIAALLSERKPYLNAFLAGLFAITCFLVMFISPVAQVTFELVSVLTQLVLPVPFALLGAYVFVRRQSDG